MKANAGKIVNTFAGAPAFDRREFFVTSTFKGRVTA